MSARDDAAGGSRRQRELVRRLEARAGAGLVVVLVAAGLAYTAGLTEPVGDEGVVGRRAFRPLVADLRGEVEYRPRGAAAWRPLRWSDAFSEGDRLRTGPEGSCDVLLTWGTGFRVAAGSELLWERLQSDGRWADVELHLSRGEVFASLDALPEGSKFVVVTPHSRTRVKGTVLTVAADEEEARTTVLEGVVEVVDRVDPNRRVDVTRDETAAFGRGEADGPRPLSVEERARILGELASVEEGIARLSPSAEELDASKGSLSIRADARRPSGAGQDGASRSGSDAEAEGPSAARDEEDVARLLRAGLGLLSRGQVEQGLGLCTTTFRAIVWGDMALRAGAVREFAREQGDGRALQARDEVRSQIQLDLELVSLDVVVDGDVAYGAATVRASAQPNAGGGLVVRVYACTARCVRKDGRWRVDLATAAEKVGQ